MGGWVVSGVRVHVCVCVSVYVYVVGGRGHEQTPICNKMYVTDC